ncbi:PLP-dependent aminotransferase family protein [Sphingobium sufflavum]|uniref:aminotransferase-like domain-containing protein n=1 Tax=Sphingobium sufflavum TaxID=1129547 RepID=UPI001F182FB6|nr:PLP-dependent aminotransferase family protein [Sphingobium sufflavum]MCE7798324.1 PLP-dependent aminotransferase family protein [Sphingobium sufflavum]
MKPPVEPGTASGIASDIAPGWMPDLSTTGGPRYLAIVEALEQAIRTGVLRPGERLPTQRDLARHLGIDLTTVTRAYGLARDGGLIEGVGKLGSFVRNSAGHAMGAATEESGMIVPPQPAFGLLGEAMRTGLTRLLRAGGGSPLLQYQPAEGSVQDRRQAAMAFTARGLPTGPDQVVLTAGGQNGLQGIVATVLARGDRLCLGRSAYPGMLSTARRQGLRLVPLGQDAGGIDPDAVRAAAEAGARALYVVPTNDNPTTATLDVERRHALVAIARRYDMLLIEDDAYGLLPARPLPPLAALAPERTWHIASVAKIISPVLRVAHVRVPDGVDPGPLARATQETAVMPPPINAALVTSWLRDGSFERLVAAVRAEGVARQRIAARHLAGFDAAAHAEGYHLWLAMPRGVDPVMLAGRVGPVGLSIVAGQAFASDPRDPARAVRLSIGGAMDHGQLDRAFAWLAASLRGEEGTARGGGLRGKGDKATARQA